MFILKINPPTENFHPLHFFIPIFTFFYFFALTSVRIIKFFGILKNHPLIFFSTPKIKKKNFSIFTIPFLKNQFPLKICTPFQFFIPLPFLIPIFELDRFSIKIYFCKSVLLFNKLKKFRIHQRIKVEFIIISSTIISATTFAILFITVIYSF